MDERLKTIDLNRTVDLDKTKAHRELKQLASKPLDLTPEAPPSLSEERILAMKASGAGFDLLFATERITGDVLAALQRLADEARVVDQFIQMMRGARMNRSEDLPVLHAASRNVFDDEDLRCEHDDAPGQKYAVENAREQLAELETFLEDVDTGRIGNSRGEPFTDLVQIGIGGSDLGPRAIHLALRGYWRKDHRVHFVSNVDPDDAAQVLDGLDLSRTLVNVVSKSGDTLETVTNEAIFERQFVRKGLERRNHFVCVTREGSKMDDPLRYRRCFYMYDYIGGRFSATSMVGGVALGFGLGYDNFLELLRGAREMDLNALNHDIHRNPPLLAALIGIWNRNYLQCESLAILPYSQMLSRFVAHLQQLDMESNGKRVNRRGKALRYATGPIVWGEAGTNAQHAFFQLLHQSEMVIPCEFIGFRKSQMDLDSNVEGTSSQVKLLANLLAQARALARGMRAENPNDVFPGNRPSSILIAEELGPRTLGALLAFYENKVAFQGFLWNINSFDQKGVELGKRQAKEFLARFKSPSQDPEHSGAESDRADRAMMEAAGLVRPRQGGQR